MFCAFIFVLLIFFFQAEDGIRDIGVTWSSDVCSSDLFNLQVSKSGLGTFALTNRPYSKDQTYFTSVEMTSTPQTYSEPVVGVSNSSTAAGAGSRSEERRVGQECRSRWSPHH